MGRWFSDQLSHVGLPAIVALAAAMYGFYLLTNSTLQTHGGRLDKLDVSIEAQQKLASDAVKQQNTEREKVRDAFLANSRDTATALAELSKQTAIIGTTLGSLEKSLDKIDQKLGSVNVGPR